MIMKLVMQKWSHSICHNNHNTYAYCEALFCMVLLCGHCVSAHSFCVSHCTVGGNKRRHQLRRKIAVEKKAWKLQSMTTMLLWGMLKNCLLPMNSWLWTTPPSSEMHWIQIVWCTHLNVHMESGVLSHPVRVYFSIVVVQHAKYLLSQYFYRRL